MVLPRGRWCDLCDARDRCEHAEEIAAARDEAHAEDAQRGLSLEDMLAKRPVDRDAVDAHKARLRAEIEARRPAPHDHDHEPDEIAPPPIPTPEQAAGVRRRMDSLLYRDLPVSACDLGYTRKQVSKLGPIADFRGRAAAFCDEHGEVYAPEDVRDFEREAVRAEAAEYLSRTDPHGTRAEATLVWAMEQVRSKRAATARKCDLCDRLAVAMVGESNELLVCHVHLEDRRDA